QGNIWFGVLGIGLQRFNPKTEKFTLFSADKSTVNSLIDNRIDNVLFLNGKILVFTHSGVGAFFIKTEKFKSYSNVYTALIYKVSDNDLWLLSDNNELSYYDFKSD